MPNKYAPILEKFQTTYTDKTQTHEGPKLTVGPKLDEPHLDKVEAQLGHPLPEDYREFLRDYAGIWLSNFAVFPLNKGGYTTEASIWGFEDSRENQTLADSYHEALDSTEMSNSTGKDVYPGIHLLRDVPGPVEELGWPEELLPIGIDQGGNFICLALFGLRPGAIFHFGRDIHLIANSFDEFMHLLQPSKD